MTNGTQLHLMIKPPAEMGRALGRCRQVIGLHDRYPADRLHCTMLDLGDGDDWPREKIDRLRRALGTVAAEPFEVSFDRLDGRILRGQPGMAAAGAFHAELKRCVSLAGFTLPLHIFWLHLTLAFTGPQVPPTMIDPVGWLVEDFRLIRSVHGRGHEELGCWTLERRQFGLAL